MTFDYFALCLSVFATVIAQIFLKVAAREKHNSVYRIWVLGLGYCLLFFAFIFNIIGLRTVPLHHMVLILSATIVLVPIASMYLLSEAQSQKFWIGFGFVSAGTLIFGSG